MMISNRMSLIDASGIREVFNLAAKLKEPINLSIGQPDFDVPDELKSEAINAINQGFNQYTPTQGILPLRERIAQKLYEENNINVSPDEVLVTSGVSGALSLIFYVLLDRGDEIIVFDPYFVSYKHLVNFTEAVPIYVAIYPYFCVDIDNLTNVISKKTKAIVINTPANPTGKVLSRKELEQIAGIADRYNLTIISDEVYEKFVYDKPHISIGSIYPKTITLNGFSKAYAMTGWRIGYAAGDKKIIQEMAKLQQYTFVCAPSFAQKAAIKALEFDVGDYIKEYKLKRDRIYKGLKDYFDVVMPEGGFYMFPRAPEGISATEFVKKAIKNNLLIIPGSVFSEYDTHFRLSFATSNDTIDRGVEILKAMVTSDDL